MSWQPSGRFADPRKREGELMWASRVPEATVAALEELLGEIGTAGQLQQRPIPRGGGIVRPEQFMRYHPQDIQGTYDAPEFFDFQAMTTDAAFKDTQSSSYVVVQCWGRKAAKSYLLAQVRERMSFTKTIAAIKQMRQDYPKANSCLIEDKANGPAIIDVLSREIPGIIAVEPIGSKEARAEAAAPLIHAGNIYLPHESWCKWTLGFIAEWCAVPTGAFWDQVDASDQYMLKYGRLYKVDMSKLIEEGVSNSDITAEQSGSPWAIQSR